MFQFTNYSLLLLCIYNKILEVCSSGFPHSDIHGSMDICSSPRLFAAYHVLLRLSVPRHSPYALGRLTRNIFLFNCQVSWWRWGDSNSWPPACKAGALPTELRPHEWLRFILDNPFRRIRYLFKVVPIISSFCLYSTQCVFQVIWANWWA